MRKERKHYTAEEKVALLRRHLLDKVPVSDLCEELGLQPTVFYRWQKEFFENGAAAFQKFKVLTLARAAVLAPTNFRFHAALFQHPRLFSSTETGNSTRRSHTVETTQSEKPISTNGVGS